MATNLIEARAKNSREKKQKTKVIEAEERERCKTLVENEAYPIFTIGVSFKMDEKTGRPVIHSDPQQGTGIIKVIKNPEINTNVAFAYVQQLYQMLKAEIINGSKNNLKKVN